MYSSVFSFKNFPTIFPSNIEKLLFSYGLTWAGALVYCITFLNYFGWLHLVSQSFVDDFSWNFEVELKIG